MKLHLVKFFSILIIKSLVDKLYELVKVKFIPSEQVVLGNVKNIV